MKKTQVYYTVAETTDEDLEIYETFLRSEKYKDFMARKEAGLVKYSSLEKHSN